MTMRDFFSSGSPSKVLLIKLNTLCIHVVPAAHQADKTDFAPGNQTFSIDTAFIANHSLPVSFFHSPIISPEPSGALTSFLGF